MYIASDIEKPLPPPPRSPSGYREYDKSTTHRIHFIKGAQGLGLKLAEIRELLEIQDRGACPCGHTMNDPTCECGPDCLCDDTGCC